MKRSDLIHPHPPTSTAHHSIPDAEARDVVPHLDDRAREIAAEDGRVRQRPELIELEDGVDGIDSDGGVVDDDFVFGGRRIGGGADFEGHPEAGEVGGCV